MKKICSHCKGEGIMFYENQDCKGTGTAFDCSECKGTGIINVVKKKKSPKHKKRFAYKSL